MNTPDVTWWVLLTCLGGPTVGIAAVLYAMHRNEKKSLKTRDDWDDSRRNDFDL